MQQIMKTEGAGVDHKNTYRHHRCAIASYIISQRCFTRILITLTLIFVKLLTSLNRLISSTAITSNISDTKMVCVQCFFFYCSLNQSQRQREMERVAKENREMLKRLEKVEPIYKVSDWIENWRRKEDITGMITAYPDDFQAIVSLYVCMIKNCHPQSRLDHI